LLIKGGLMGEYDDMNVEELRDEASARDIQGRSGMNKEQLVAALEANDRGEEAPAAAAAEGEAPGGTWEELQSNPENTSSDAAVAAGEREGPVQEEEAVEAE
jgi:hypothetical protein